MQNTSMSKSKINPGAFYTLPSGNIIKIGAMPAVNGCIECRYVDGPDQGGQVALTGEIISKFGAHVG